MKIQNNTDINKISSIYNLKSLFCYLQYPFILKLVKKNKNLQNKLDISIENYKEIVEYPKYEYHKCTSVKEKKKKKGEHSLEEIFYSIIATCCTCLMAAYMITYSILLVTIGNFDDSNTKENYSKSSANIIKTINQCTFILDAVIIASPFLMIYYILENHFRDYGIKKIVKTIIVALIDLTHIGFEILIILKLALSYKIKKNGVTWFMVMDYVFIFLHVLYMIYIFLLSCIFYSESGKDIKTVKYCYLKSFNYIKIQEYFLPEDFHSWRKNRRKKFVSEKCKLFKYHNTLEERDILQIINSKRSSTNLLKLAVNTTDEIPNFILNKPTELMLNPFQNIIKISEKQFLFKYPVGTFMNYLNKNNEQIFDIILKKNLNNIQMVTQKDYLYILVSEKSFFIPSIFDSNISKKNVYINDEDYDYDYSIDSRIDVYKKLLYSNTEEYFD